MLSGSAAARRVARKQERREAIIGIAARSFLENGYAATSMSSIAAELGGSKGTLWSHFASKAELFAAVLDKRTIAYRAQLETLLDPGEDLRASLREFYRSFIAKATAPEAIALHRLVIAEAHRFPEIGMIFFDRAPRMARETVAEFLAGQMARGILRKGDPQRAAQVLISLCLGGIQQEVLWGASPPDSRQIEVEADYAVDLFLSAFEPDGATSPDE